MSRLKRIRANAVASGFGKLLVVGNQLLLIPLFLAQWGAEYYGEWLLLSALPSVLALSNVGVGTAGSTRIVLAIGGGDERGANSTCISAIAVSAVVSGLMIVTAYFIPFEAMGANSWQFLSDPRRVFLLMVVTLTIGLLTQSFEGYWIARQRAAEAIYYRNGLLALRLAATAAVLLYGGRAIELVAMQLIVTLTWGILYVWKSFTQVNKSAGGQWDPRLARSLVGIGLGFQLSPLWQAMLFQGSLWVANFLFGPVGVATWGTIRTLSRSGNQMLSLVNQSVMPELQNAVAAKNLADARRIHSTSVILCLLLAAVAAISLSLAGGTIYQFWTAGQLDVPWTVWPLLGLGILFNSLWWTSAIVHRAFNRPWFMNAYGVIASAVSLVFMAGFGNVWGMAGLVVGYLIFDVLMTFVVMKRSLILLEDTALEAMQRNLKEMTKQRFLKWIRYRVRVGKDA